MMETKTKHWGEFASCDDDDETENIPDVSAEIERSMSKFFLDEIDKDASSHKINQHIKMPPTDPLILHAIALHSYINRITDGINETNDIKRNIPQRPVMTYKFKPNSLNYVAKEMTDFGLGLEVDVPDIKKSVVVEILRKCIATLFAHIGYESSQQSALDVLVNVLEDFFRMITHKFKVAIEDENQRQFDGFPHVIERVLTELGLGGVQGLNDYYQNRVLKYVDVLQDRCRHLNDHYCTLNVPKAPSPVDKINSVVRVKVEEEDVVEVENHEVHLADNIEGDVSFSILEPGYQLLNSLEQNLQTDVEEDIAVTQSPDVVSISSESDISHLSPYNKKKRFK